MEHFDTKSKELNKAGMGRGMLHYLSTLGGSAPFMNPMTSRQLRITTSGWTGPISSLVGNSNRISRSRGMQGSWFCVELAVFVIPSHYSLRHAWTSREGALYSWNFLGSADGKEWHVLREHYKDASLAKGGFSSHTWEIERGNVSTPCRFFKVQSTGPHIGTGDQYLTDYSDNPCVVRRRLRTNEGAGGGRHFLYCCGFEMYGEVTSPPPEFSLLDPKSISDNWEI